jgi:hypothetical protein
MLRVKTSGRLQILTESTSLNVTYEFVKFGKDGMRQVAPFN